MKLTDNYIGENRQCGEDLFKVNREKDFYGCENSENG